MTLFASADAHWVGTRVGAAGLAAVSTSLFWIWMLVAVAEMVSVGLTAVAARRHGEGRPDEAARTAGEALVYAVALGAAFALLGTVWLREIVAVTGTPPEVAALAREYLGTYLLGMPLIYGYFVVDAAFRAAGDTRTPLALLSSSVAVTLVLDPLFIGGAGTLLPALGVRGAAVATLLTRGAVGLAGALILARRGLLRFGPVRPRALATISRIGLPVALTGVLFSVVYVAITPVTARFGTPALAALGVGHRVESWLYMIGVGFGAAAAAIVGQNLGAGDAGRAARAGWLTTGYAMLPALGFAALSLAVPEQLAGLFTSDPAVIDDAARYLRIASLGQLVVCAEVVLEASLGGAGDTLPAMIASTSITAVRIPLAAWAAVRYGIDGLWWTITLTAVVRAVAIALIWRAGRWKLRRV
jgi:putative MATE family efflux protein